jgi:hypothetical protein
MPSWEESEMHIKSKLDQIEKHSREDFQVLFKAVEQLKIDVAQIQTKVFIFSGLSAFIASIIVKVIS